MYRIAGSLSDQPDLLIFSLSALDQGVTGEVHNLLLLLSLPRSSVLSSPSGQLTAVECFEDSCVDRISFKR